MRERNEGLTDIYNMFHSPDQTTKQILNLRETHRKIDTLALRSYGWNDLNASYGFGVEQVEIDNYETLPEDLREQIEGGGLFFLKASDAMDVENQLRTHGAIEGKKKLPWRYRWPDEVRDDVLGRLLALNAERYGEEVAQGLHSKGKKTTGTASGKKRGRPAKAAASESSEQMGLGL